MNETRFTDHSRVGRLNGGESPADGLIAMHLGKQFKKRPVLRDVSIGNEPNLNLFWMPQFGPNGEDVAATAYLALLAAAYDAVKAVSPDVNVIGGLRIDRHQAGSR